MNRGSLGSMMLSLGVISVVAGALLGAVKVLTYPRVEEAARMVRVRAVESVVPAFDNDPVSESFRVAVGSGDSLLVYPARHADALVGMAVESLSHQGFSGDISVMVGFDAEGVVTGYSVISHGETPGLGARMDEWFRLPDGHRSIIGLRPSSSLAVTKDGGEIDGITAATITSRAFLDAVRLAHEAFVKSQHT